MYFDLSEEHLMIRQAARDFAHKELLPGVIERDEHQKFPAEQVKMLGELGFLGMMVSPEYGGSGLDSVQTSVDKYKTAADAKRSLSFWKKLTLTQTDGVSQLDLKASMAQRPAAKSWSSSTQNKTETERQRPRRTA